MTNEKILPHTYHSQRDNADDPSTPQVEAYVTCNVTSLSMALSCLGIEIPPMELFKRANSPEYVAYAQQIGVAGFIKDKKLAQVWAILEKLANEHCHAQFKTDWLTLQAITDQIDAGNPIVVGGLFTHGGHIICIVGYNSLGFICTDPWGDWAHGYVNRNGDNVLYEYDKIRQVLSGNGSEFWSLVLKK